MFNGPHHHVLMDDTALRISMRRKLTFDEGRAVLDLIENLSDGGGVVLFDSPEGLLAFIDSASLLSARS